MLTCKDGRFGGAGEGHGEHWPGWQIPSGVDCLFGQVDCALVAELIRRDQYQVRRSPGRQEPARRPP